MSIGDELREAARTHVNAELYVTIEADNLFDIANHIDEEHERAVKELSDTLDRRVEDLRLLARCYSSKSEDLTSTTIALSEAYDQIDELRKLVQDMWFWRYKGHMDNESQEWQMKHIDGVLDRMHKLGVEEDLDNSTAAGHGEADEF